MRGFRRLTLQPGEARAVAFDLSPRDLGAVGPDGTRRVLGGRYRGTVGGGQPGTEAPTQAAEVHAAEVQVMDGAPLPL